MSDSDDDGPPPPNGGGTGLYRRLTIAGSTNQLHPVHPPSNTASPMSHQSSFQWEACQSFRLYATHSRSVMANRRGTTLMIEGTDNNATDLKSAFKALKDYISLYGTTTVSSDSQLPINIRKGKLIGSGGFAEVYSGINLVTGELVAIKEIRISDTSNRKELQAVEEEFALLRQFRHPNVVRYILFEQSVSQKMCRIVMEFMAGGSAQGLLQKFGALTESIVRKFAADILHGISFIHKEGIVHRDIKPANLLVSATGQVKLADFGCSRRITEINTGTSCIIGTPVYMAPEFIRGDTNPKADIWAMGCTLFELATGLPPWHHAAVKDNLPLMFYITTTYESPLVLPKDDDREFSDNFIDFLEKCFIRDVSRRPSADELLTHPWILDTSSCDLVQREIEDVTVMQTVELCQTLSTEPLMETKEVDSCTSTPRAGDRDSVDTADTSSPPVTRLAVEGSTRNSPQFLTNSAFDPGASLSASQLNGSFQPNASQSQNPLQSHGQFLLLNQEKGSLEFAQYSTTGQSGNDTAPVIEEPQNSPKSATNQGRGARRSLSNVSFMPDPSVGDSPSMSLTVAPSPGAIPQLALDGPVHMSFSFNANGEKVSVGLQIQPEDVTCRIVDRKPSFVVAMNEHIRGQLTSAMMELSHRRSHSSSHLSVDDVTDK